MSGSAAGGDAVLKNVQNNKGTPVPYAPTAVPSFAQMLNGAPVNLQGTPVNLNGASIASQLARPAQPMWRGMQGGFQDLITPQVAAASLAARNIDPTVSVGNVLYSNQRYDPVAAQSFRTGQTPSIVGISSGAGNGPAYSAPTGSWVGNNWVPNTPKKTTISNGWN